MSDKKKSKDKDLLIQKREAIFAKIERFKSWLEHNPHPKVFELKVRRSNLEKHLTEFENIQTEIDAITMVVDDEQRVFFEDIYYETLSQADEILEKFNGKTDRLPEIKLPPIIIPIFDGSIHKWDNFHDLFQSLIENNVTLTTVQKFQYLKSSLEGDALKIISNLDTSEANYRVALNLLQKRYENKKRVPLNHVMSLFELQSIQKESYTQLRHFLDTFQTHIGALTAVGLSEKAILDLFLISLLSSKLDKITLKQWESKVSEKQDLPTYEFFCDFLGQRCNSLEAYKRNVTLGQGQSSQVHSQSHTKNQSGQMQNIYTNKLDNRPHHSNSFIATQASSQLNKTCVFCSKPHKFYACEQFLKMAVTDRVNEVKKLKLCLNCLASDHFSPQCKSGSCKKCNKKHNSLLHIDNYFDENKSQTITHTCQEVVQTKDSAIPLEHSQLANNNNLPQTSHTLHSQLNEFVSNFGSSQILLGTALVNVSNENGVTVKCRVLLDSGSQCNFVTQEMCTLLKLIPKLEKVTIKGVNNSITHTSKSVKITVSSLFNSFTTRLNFLVLPKITECLPIVSVNVLHFEMPQNLNLADPQLNISHKIDMLIGAEMYFDLLLSGYIKLHKNGPSIQNTKLGWVVAGRLNSNQSVKTSQCNLITDEQLNNYLRKFWELEEVFQKSPMTKEENECELHFQHNFSRNQHGRFVVRLPFKDNVNYLSHSKEMALKRYYNLEKRFKNNLEFKTEYSKFMKEYLELGHMSLVTNDDNQGYYMPHHAVYKMDSLTTKLRVVLDASAPTASGISLNDILMKGPVVQREIFEIITCFRFHNVAFTADVAKMYRQVNVHEKDRHFQKILWRDNVDKPIQTYMLNTVTYGTTSAPFLATRCLKQLSLEHQTNFPNASNSIKDDFYVDDLLTGAPNEEDATTLYKEIIHILNSSCFELRKWRSSHPNIFSCIHSTIDKYIMPQDKLENSKVLGMIWDSNKDNFKFYINHDPDKIYTKRIILSNISQIYDPLGLLGPVVTIAKLILQKLWSLKIDWDENLPQEEYHQWYILSRQLNSLNNLTIPRRITGWSECTELQIHGFCDASERAYGACIYLRSTNLQGNQHSAQLLCSKGRVAPIKSISLPRLELCAAVLLSQLVVKLKKCIKFKINSFHYWTDSTIVLSWIAATPQTWKTFVANRVAEIQTHTNIYDWSHVSGKENSADAISRGSLPEQFLKHTLWWYGPPWLQQDALYWPKGKAHSIETKEEKRTIKVLSHLTTDLEITKFNIFEKYSTLSKLKRVTAYLLRFKSKHKGHLSATELHNSLMTLIKITQAQSFPEELKSLQKKKPLHVKSKLLPLSCFLDNHDIIRVGGRLKNATIPFNQKHPILLPSSHKLTELIIRNEHISLLHAGHQTVLASLRSKHWPLSARNAIRKVIHKCLICSRLKPITQVPVMGDLPQYRVNQYRPFLKVGIDYAGPVSIRESRRRGRVNTYLCYIVIFVCLSTKAVHMELVSGLTTEAFLSSLKRFMARRGKCTDIFSDNATNFVKANRTLKELSLLSSEQHWNKITDYSSNNTITWHFIPPRSPTFGGLWEATVKSLKHHLRRITANAVFTYEEYLTFLIQSEGILNSRPLTPLSENPTDFQVLTPAHFLIGEILTSSPEPNYKDVPINRLDRWNHIQYLYQHLWRRWSSEYLTHLQNRSKWKSQKPNLQRNQLVLVKEDNLPPLHWKMGRIVDLHPGTDKIVRVVSVKTADGLYKRAVNKVCLLPIDPS